MEYSKLINILSEYQEETFALFQRRLIPTNQTILGVRTPKLREISKMLYKTTDIEEIMRYPDEYYEVTFINLTIVSFLPYGTFIKHVEKCVDLIDNWATCDSFKPKCILKNKREFLPVLDSLFEKGTQFSVRFALVTLLFGYMEEEYLPLIRSYIEKADTKPYYIYMAVAWLVAEILVKHYEYGVELLKGNVLDNKTHNKSIQKAIESYRLTNGQKEYLRSLKIKK